MTCVTENAACARQWDRVATGRRHASLHMDVRFLARPIAEDKPHPPSIYLQIKPLLASVLFGQYRRIVVILSGKLPIIRWLS